MLQRLNERCTRLEYCRGATIHTSVDKNDACGTHGFRMLKQDYPLAQRAVTDVIYSFTLEFVAISGVAVISPANPWSRRKKYHS